MPTVEAVRSRPVSTVKIGGMRITTASRTDLVEMAIRDCEEFRRNENRLPQLIFDANGHALSMREADAQYREAVDQADLIHADGGFLITVSRFKGKTPIKERSATTDMIHDLAAAAERAGLTFYLLGASEEVNLQCTERLQQLYPKLRIVGRRNGYFSAQEEEGVIEMINAVVPDILWVGMGKPKEQIFSAQNRSRIKAGWIVTCGGCYNYVTGHYGRAPQWMQDANLEWVFRAATEPRKLLWRYITTTPHALWLSIFGSRQGASR